MANAALRKNKLAEIKGSADWKVALVNRHTKQLGDRRLQSALKAKYDQDMKGTDAADTITSDVKKVTISEVNPYSPSNKKESVTYYETDNTDLLSSLLMTIDPAAAARIQTAKTQTMQNLAGRITTATGNLTKLRKALKDSDAVLNRLSESDAEPAAKKALDFIKKYKIEGVFEAFDALEVPEVENRTREDTVRRNKKKFIEKWKTDRNYRHQIQKAIQGQTDAGKDVLAGERLLQGLQSSYDQQLLGRKKFKLISRASPPIG